MEIITPDVFEDVKLLLFWIRENASYEFQKSNKSSQIRVIKCPKNFCHFKIQLENQKRFLLC